MGLQFVIGLLITSLACEFSWIILSPKHPIKGKKKKTRFGRIGRILYDSTILYDPTRSYHFYDPTTILNVLVRRDSKIMRSYNLNHDFDNYGWDSPCDPHITWRNTCLAMCLHALMRWNYLLMPFMMSSQPHSHHVR